MSSSEDVPKAAKRRIPRPLVAIAALLLAYAGMWLASSWMSSSLLDGAKLRLVYPTGQPVNGVAVLARWWEPRVRATGGDLARSDANGFVDLAPLRGKTAVLGKFEVAVLLPGYDEEPTVLSHDTTITLPAVGSLVVRLVDEAGNAWLDPSIVHMKARLQWAKGEAFQMFRPDGRAIFERVACAKTQLHTDLQGYEHAKSGQMVDGPAGANEIRQLEVTIANDAPRLIGVIHDEAGKAMATPLTFSMTSPSATFAAHPIASGPDGAWCFLLSSTPSHGSVQLTHPTLGSADIELPKAQGSTIDLGVVQFPN